MPGARVIKPPEHGLWPGESKPYLPIVATSLQNLKPIDLQNRMTIITSEVQTQDSSEGR
jgi:hypothetical protein